MTVSQAAASGVGLFEQPFELMSGGDCTAHILYDTRQMIEQFTTTRRITKKIFLGVIEIKENHGHGRCNNAVEVAAVAAEKGYGPLLYDIAMSEHGILMPDRENLSPAAAKVWEFYRDRGDITTVAFDDIDDPTGCDSDACCKMYDTQNPNYKEDPRNMSYEANFTLGTNSLSKNHSKALSDVIDHFKLKKGLRVKAEDIEAMLGRRARQYFVEVYRKKVLGI